MVSWRSIDEHSDFPLENLPYGAFRKDGGATHLGVAVGEDVLDLAAVANAGLVDDICERELLEAGALNPFLAAGRTTWSALRERLTALLVHDGDSRIRSANVERFFVRQRDVELVLPIEIGDYVDFYSSIEHATNLGRLFRPDGEALMPNWRHLPVGYHGRSSTIVIDGTPIVRPSGQRKPAGAALPEYAPSARLDIELEVGFITGPGNRLGDPIPASDAREHIFGVVLVNDWSARDIQAWEYQPLGPFLGKSFATTLSPWIVTLEALEPFRSRGPRQEPEPLPYLRTQEPWAYDISLAVDLQSADMREKGLPAQTVSRTTFAHMYWNMAQQLAHATANGTAIRPGDLYASGTISGTTPESQGSFIELTWNGERPLELSSGERRAFLADGDAVTLRGWCERPGARRIGFGAARGTILPARHAPVGGSSQDLK